MKNKKITSAIGINEDDVGYIRIGGKTYSLPLKSTKVISGEKKKLLKELKKLNI